VNPKQMLIVCTMVITISLGGSIWSNKTFAVTYLEPIEAVQVEKEEDPFLEALGVSSDEEVYEALYHKDQTLADLAAERQGDLDALIRLQTAQLEDQLQERLASGSLPPDQYEQIRSELTVILTNSAYGQGHSA